MVPLLSCPRCGVSVTSLGPQEQAQCPVHGPVMPMRRPQLASDEVLAAVSRHAQVPLWLPWPIPTGWAVTGVRWAGTGADGPVATALALTGANPLALDPEDPPAADVVLLAEQPGVGMAAHLAGLGGIDVGDRLGRGTPDLHLAVNGHQTPMWSFALGTSEQITAGTHEGAAFVGEALGVWLWVLTWPSSAAALLLGDIELVDMRSPEHRYLFAHGPLSPRLNSPQPLIP